MDPKIKKDWIDALRSGKYEQGQSVLLKNGKYCCLGVLCETSNLFDKIETSDSSEVCFELKNQPSCYPVSAEFNRTHLDALGLDAHHQIHLISMNDGTHGNPNTKSFLEIADWIEKNV